MLGTGGSPVAVQGISCLYRSELKLKISLEMGLQLLWYLHE